MAEESINVADDFVIGEEEMTTVLLIQTFDEGVFWTKKNCLYCFM